MNIIIKSALILTSSASLLACGGGGGGGGGGQSGGGESVDGGNTDTGGGNTDTGGGNTDTGGGNTDTGGGNTDTGGGNTDTGGGNTDTGVGSPYTGGGYTTSQGQTGQLTAADADYSSKATSSSYEGVCTDLVSSSMCDGTITVIANGDTITQDFIRWPDGVVTNTLNQINDENVSFVDELNSHSRSGARAYGAGVYNLDDQQAYSYYFAESFEAITDGAITSPPIAEHSDNVWTWENVYTLLHLSAEDIQSFWDVATYRDEGGTITANQEAGTWEAELAGGYVELNGTIDGTNVTGAARFNDINGLSYYGSFDGEDGILDGQQNSVGAFAGSSGDGDFSFAGAWDTSLGGTYSAQ